MYDVLRLIKKKKKSLNVISHKDWRSVVVVRLEQVSASQRMTKDLLRTRMMLAEICTGKKLTSHSYIHFTWLFMVLINSHLLKVLWHSSSRSFPNISPISFMQPERQVFSFKLCKMLFSAHFTQQYGTRGYLHPAKWLPNNLMAITCIHTCMLKPLNPTCTEILITDNREKWLC